MFDNFGLKDLYGIENINGTVSSFGNTENVTKRTGSVEIPEETKELIKNDSELQDIIQNFYVKFIKEIEKYDQWTTYKFSELWSDEYNQIINHLT